jgi:hypothetical protein
MPDIAYDSTAISIPCFLRLPIRCCVKTTEKSHRILHKHVLYCWFSDTCHGFKEEESINTYFGEWKDTLVGCTKPCMPLVGQPKSN